MLANKNFGGRAIPITIGTRPSEAADFIDTKSCDRPHFTVPRPHLPSLVPNTPLVLTSPCPPVE